MLISLVFVATSVSTQGRGKHNIKHNTYNIIMYYKYNYVLTNYWLCFADNNFGWRDPEVFSWAVSGW